MRLNIPSNKAYLGGTGHLKLHNHPALLHPHGQTVKSDFEIDSGVLELKINGTLQKRVVLKAVIEFIDYLGEYLHQVNRRQRGTISEAVIANVGSCKSMTEKLFKFQNGDEGNNQTKEKIKVQAEDKDSIIESYRQKIAQYSCRITELQNIHYSLVSKLEQAHNQNQVLTDYNTVLKDQICKLTKQSSSQGSISLDSSDLSRISAKQQNFQGQNPQEEIKKLNQQLQIQKQETIEIIEGYKNQIQKVIDSQCCLKQRIMGLTEQVKILEIKNCELSKINEEICVQGKRKQGYWNDYRTQKQRVIGHLEQQIIGLNQEMAKRLRQIEELQKIEAETMTLTLKKCSGYISEEKSHLTSITNLKSRVDDVENPEFVSYCNSMLTHRQFGVCRVEKIKKLDQQ